MYVRTYSCGGTLLLVFESKVVGFQEVQLTAYLFEKYSSGRLCLGRRNKTRYVILNNTGLGKLKR